MSVSEGIEIAASAWGKKKSFLESFALGALLVHYPFWKFNPHVVGTLLLWITMIISLGSGAHYVLSFFREVFDRQQSARGE